MGSDLSLADIMLLPIAGYLMKTPEGKDAIAASTRLARWWIAAAYPDPVPISSTLLEGLSPSASTINATTYGCEIVCPSSIGSGESW